MSYLLNFVYLVLLVLYVPGLVVGALRKGKYRAGLAEKILGSVPRRDSTQRCIWIHAVSLGEVSLIGSLVSELRRRQPRREIVISTTTVTGFALAKSRYPELTVFYAPLDFSWAVRRAVDRIRPEMLVLAELELWPNLIAAAKRSGAKVAIVNGRLSDRSFAGYSRLRWLVRPVLQQLDLIAAQDKLYAERFLALGARSASVRVTGSLKFDGAQTDRANTSTTRLRQLAAFASDDVVFLAGSTQAPEEQLALDAYRQLALTHPRLRLIVVPRHPERFEEVARLLDASGLRWQRRTALDTTPHDPAARILLVDRVGELAAWWGTASIAYVGGSMGKRNGQNMIEPAAYGAAVSFGPMTRNFRDVVALFLADDAAIVVHDGHELTRFVRCCLDHPREAQALGERARRVVASQLGATARTADCVEAMLPTLIVPPAARSAA